MQIPSVFSTDARADVDHLGRQASARFLAEVIAHRTAQTPFGLMVFGPAGSGKSSFVSSLLAAVERLNIAAGEAGLATPFVSDLAIARVEAEPGRAPASALMRQVAAALGTGYPRLAAEAAHAGHDPRAVARHASEALLDVRQKLEAERQSLDGLRGRQARLADVLLFETPGSTVDEHARRSRSRIERTMRGFGFEADPVTDYKHAVRDASEHGAGVERWTSDWRALWAFRGQTRLLVLAVALIVAAWGLGLLQDNQDRVLDLVRSGGDKLGSTADWLGAQWHWLAPAKNLLELAALAAVGLNILRAIRFLLPIHRGARLLRTELDSRRRELDGLLAHHTRRVDALAREAETASRHVAEAEARLAATGGPSPALPAWAGTAGGEAVAGDEAARAFFVALERHIGTTGQEGPSGNPATGPNRLVVAIDGLDDLPSDEAASYLQVARTLLARPGMITVASGDRMHVLDGLAEADPALGAARLDRLVQIPFTLTEADCFPEATSFARALLGADPAGVPVSEPSVDEGRVSALDRPWTQRETAVVEALAPFAGTTPRSVKRFVNLYRIARADPRMAEASAKELAALAIGLALQSAGSLVDPRQVQTSGGMDDAAWQARKAASSALGLSLSALDGDRGYETARTYGTGR